MDLSEEYFFSSSFNDKYDISTRRILRTLSENSRASIAEISKSARISRKTVTRKLGPIEKEFGVKYTLEFNEQSLGITNPHLIMVKFKAKPDLQKLSKILNSSYIPQLTVLTKGGYEMLIYAVALTSSEYAHWDRSMQILLSTYHLSWESSEVVHKQLGFFPLREELLEKLAIPEKYKGMLKILNQNSRASFQEMSKKLGMHFNTVAYNFTKLVKLGYIKRFTLTIKPLPETTTMSFFSKYSPSKGYEESSAKARKAFMEDDEDSLLSRYILCCQLVGSHDFFSVGIFDDFKTAYKSDILYHKYVQKSQGIKINYAIVDQILQGSLPIRSLDTKKVYDTIKWIPPSVE